MLDRVRKNLALILSLCGGQGNANFINSGGEEEEAWRLIEDIFNYYKNDLFEPADISK
jgi:hypothetical protein